MVRKVVGSMSDWSGVLKDLFRKIEDGSITLSQLKSFNDHVNPFSPDNSLEAWQNLYRDFFGIKVDLSTLQIPARKEGFDRLIVVAKGITPQIILDQCRKLFPYEISKVDGINLGKVKSARTSEEMYAVWFRDETEPDQDLRGFSDNDLKDRNVQGITLEERLLFELKYFIETSRHLDVGSVTLCTGSHESNGNVAIVYCRDRRVMIGTQSPFCGQTFEGSRQAVL
jgi:hypothetical protein